MANSNPEVVKALIKAGADVNLKTNGGVTALMLATQWNSNPEVVKALIKAGADIFAKDNEGKTTLDYADDADDEGIKRIILDAAK
ncbi:MAG: ankyrin repeat domain-containing protein [Synergistaceae bacterium]|nr:ankyrin repeat domain-containing protein [Synergistaceae bacterium]